MAAPLIENLKRRTAENAAANAAAIRQRTDQNAYTSIAGDVGRQLILDADGRNRYVSGAELQQLKEMGNRLDCPPPGSIIPCKLVSAERLDAYNRRVRAFVEAKGAMSESAPRFSTPAMSGGLKLPSLPKPRGLVCDENGRNCKFNVEQLEDGRTVTR